MYFCITHKEIYQFRIDRILYFSLMVKTSDINWFIFYILRNTWECKLIRIFHFFVTKIKDINWFTSLCVLQEWVLPCFTPHIYTHTQSLCFVIVPFLCLSISGHSVLCVCVHNYMYICMYNLRIISEVEINLYEQRLCLFLYHLKIYRLIIATFKTSVILPELFWMTSQARNILWKFLQSMLK